MITKANNKICNKIAINVVGTNYYETKYPLWSNEGFTLYNNYSQSCNILNIDPQLNRIYVDAVIPLNIDNSLYVSKITQIYENTRIIDLLKYLTSDGFNPFILFNNIGLNSSNLQLQHDYQMLVGIPYSSYEYHKNALRSGIVYLNKIIQAYNEICDSDIASISNIQVIPNFETQFNEAFEAKMNVSLGVVSSIFRLV